MKLNWKDLSLSVLLGSIFILYSYYTFLHAQNQDKYGDLMIVSLLFRTPPGQRARWRGVAVSRDGASCRM